MYTYIHIYIYTYIYIYMLEGFLLIQGHPFHI